MRSLRTLTGTLLSSMANFQLIAPAPAFMLRRAVPNHHRYRASKNYSRQGEGECARRRAQIARGQLKMDWSR